MFWPSIWVVKIVSFMTSFIVAPAIRTWSGARPSRSSSTSHVCSGSVRDTSSMSWIQYSRPSTTFSMTATWAASEAWACSQLVRRVWASARSLASFSSSSRASFWRFWNAASGLRGFPASLRAAAGAAGPAGGGRSRVTLAPGGGTSP